MNKPKQVVRCQGSIHTRHEGNILIAFSGSDLYVKCNDRDCKHWTKISINIPGLKIDLSEVGITQEVLPSDYHLHLEPATSVVLGRSR
jgi:hypothetical protein